MTALTRSTIVTRNKRVSDYHVSGHTIKPELHPRIVGYRLWLLYYSAEAAPAGEAVRLLVSVTPYEQQAVSMMTTGRLLVPVPYRRYRY